MVRTRSEGVYSPFRNRDVSNPCTTMSSPSATLAECQVKAGAEGQPAQEPLNDLGGVEPEQRRQHRRDHRQLQPDRVFFQRFEPTQPAPKAIDADEGERRRGEEFRRQGSAAPMPLSRKAASSDR